MLFVEVDNCTEPADVLAAKFEKYVRYFRARMKNSAGREVPAWRALYRPSGRDGHRPVLVVFNPGTRIGPMALKNRMNTVMELTRTVWSGDWHSHPGYGATETERDGFHDYDDAIPLLFTTLERLQAGGPRGVVAVRPPPVGTPPRRSRQPVRPNGLVGPYRTTPPAAPAGRRGAQRRAGATDLGMGFETRPGPLVQRICPGACTCSGSALRAVRTTGHPPGRGRRCPVRSARGRPALSDVSQRHAPVPDPARHAVRAAFPRKVARPPFRAWLGPATAEHSRPGSGCRVLSLRVPVRGLRPVRCRVQRRPLEAVARPPMRGGAGPCEGWWPGRGRALRAAHHHWGALS